MKRHYKTVRRSILIVTLAVLLLLTLFGCGSKTQELQLTDSEASLLVLNWQLRFVENRVEYGEADLLIDKQMQRHFTINSESNKLQRGDSTEITWAAELSLPLTAGQAAEFSQACCRWMTQNMGKIKSYDISFTADRSGSLQTADRAAPPIIYSVKDASFTSAVSDVPENAQGVAHIFALENDRQFVQVIYLIP